MLATIGTSCGKNAKSGNPGTDNPGAKSTGDSGDGNGGSARREYAVPVAISKVARASISEYVSTVGTIAPARSLSVKAEESGRICFIKPWREGQAVKQGELLARLDEEETSRDLEIAQADLDTARSDVQLALARVERGVTDFDRAKKMFEMGQISRKAYEEREFTANTARIGYEDSVIRAQRAEKSLNRLQLQMDRKKVRAPMSGYLVARDEIEKNADSSAADSADTITDLEGRLVGTGYTICGIVDMSNMVIRCEVTSKDIGRIHKDQRAEAHVYSDREVAVEGEVADVSPIMDIGTKAFEVDVAVANPQGRLRPGMFARVNVILNTRRDALIVDRKILQRRNNEDIVFVVSDQERAEKRVVRIGLENPDQVEILDGLRDGDSLVTLGYETLQDKAKVKVMETEPTVAGKNEATTSGSTTKQPGGRA
jgi:multidrug efflux pump subunit AcrA (membrane-fusion protein)